MSGVKNNNCGLIKSIFSFFKRDLMPLPVVTINSNNNVYNCKN